MAVSVFIGTQLGRPNGPKHLCRIEREHLGVGRKGGWYVVLHKSPREWAKKHRMTYRTHIMSQWEVALEIDDPRLATLFKLTWL